MNKKYSDTECYKEKFLDTIDKIYKSDILPLEKRAQNLKLFLLVNEGVQSEMISKDPNFDKQLSRKLREMTKIFQSQRKQGDKTFEFLATTFMDLATSKNFNIKCLGTPKQNNKIGKIKDDSDIFLITRIDQLYTYYNMFIHKEFSLKNEDLEHQNILTILLRSEKNIEIFLDSHGFEFQYIVFAYRSDAFAIYDNYQKYISIIERILSRVNSSKQNDFFKIFFNSETKARSKEYSAQQIDIMSLICVFSVTKQNRNLIKYAWDNKFYQIILNYYSGLLKK